MTSTPNSEAALFIQSSHHYRYSDITIGYETQTATEFGDLGDYGLDFSL